MADINSLSDRELRAELVRHGIDAPVTESTRSLVIRKLQKIASTSPASQTSPSSNGDGRLHAEPVETEVRLSNRRRSVPAASSAKTKSRQRASLAPPPDDSDTDTGEVLPQGISDEELLRQLRQYGVPCAGVTPQSRPLLVKKLNHAMARTRRRSSLVFTPPKPVSPKKAASTNGSDRQSDSEGGSTDDTDRSHPSPPRAPTAARTPAPPIFVKPPELSFSKQHSMTFGKRGSPVTSFVPPPNVVNRFVEEQEPYDTGSDSEAEARTGGTTGTHKRNWPLTTWFGAKRLPSPQSLAAKKASWWQSARSKLKVVGQWQFVAVVLPLLAVLFFACLAAFYIRASYHDHPSTRPSSSSAASPALHLLEPQLQPALASVRALLQQASVDKICAPDAAEGGPTVTDSVFLAERLGLEADVVQRLRTAVQANAQLGVVVDGDLWGVPPTRLPLWCSVKAYLWNAVVSLALVLVGLACVAAGHWAYTSTVRRRERDEQEVYSTVEAIIDLLTRHHAACVAERRPQDAYLAVSHVRDALIPLKERKSKLKMWHRAAQFLEENESRVRTESQQIEGDDYPVWRWLPPSTAYSAPAATLTAPAASPAPPPTTTTTTGVDAAAPASPQDESQTSGLLQRPKVWQGQAFSTDSSGANAPPPYPLTQCLKVRNMFEAEVEVGDSWPVRIQDAVLEKADGAKILHLAVDKLSREGCVYIKCTSAEDAGKVYRALHGWWFDGNLVTVKYLRPERYHYRFPDSLLAVQPLQPSNDKRLSLPTKFWKSPLEHF